MLQACLKVLKESICNVQLVQRVAHEATLNFPLYEPISAMMMHSGDAVQSTGQTALQDKAAVLFGTHLLASDVTGPCGAAPTVAEAFEELAASPDNMQDTDWWRRFSKELTRISKYVWPQMSNLTFTVLCHGHCVHSFLFLVGC